MKRRAGRPRQLVYVSFMPGTGDAGRDFTRRRDRASGCNTWSHAMDIVFVALGLGLFAAFGFYAAFLKRI
jgi:hypothetical protein